MASKETHSNQFFSFLLPQLFKIERKKKLVNVEQRLSLVAIFHADGRGLHCSPSDFIELYSKNLGLSLSLSSSLTYLHSHTLTRSSHTHTHSLYQRQKNISLFFTECHYSSFTPSLGLSLVFSILGAVYYLLNSLSLSLSFNFFIYLSYAVISLFFTLTLHSSLSYSY